MTDSKESHNDDVEIARTILFFVREVAPEIELRPPVNNAVLNAKADAVRTLVAKQVLDDSESPASLAFLYAIAAVGHICALSQGQIPTRRIVAMFASVVGHLRNTQAQIKELPCQN